MTNLNNCYVYGRSSGNCNLGDCFGQCWRKWENGQESWLSENLNFFDFSNFELKKPLNFKLTLTAFSLNEVSMHLFTNFWRILKLKVSSTSPSAIPYRGHSIFINVYFALIFYKKKKKARKIFFKINSQS